MGRPNAIIQVMIYDQGYETNYIIFRQKQNYLFHQLLIQKLLGSCGKKFFLL